MAEYQNLIIRQLRELSVPYIVEQNLRNAYVKNATHELYIEYQNDFSLRVNKFINEMPNNKPNPSELFKFYDKSADFQKIALEISTYFEQGLQMLSSAFNIGNESRPLLDYYGYLQVIKGIILTMVDINKESFFSTHGLLLEKNPSSNKSKYINAKIKFYGVFSAIMLCDLTNEKFPRYKEIDEIYNSKYVPSIEDVVYYTINRDPKSIFVGIWMLSSLARYEPIKWHKILQGQSDDIIKYIYEFWDSHFPYTIYLLLDKYRANVFGQWQQI